MKFIRYLVAVSSGEQDKLLQFVKKYKILIGERSRDFKSVEYVYLMTLSEGDMMALSLTVKTNWIHKALC